MSDIKEFWDDVNEESRIHKAQKQEAAKAVIAGLIDQYKLQFNELQPHQFRLQGDDKRVDIYPQRNRYFDLVAQKWGRYRDLETFLKDFFQSRL